MRPAHDKITISIILYHMSCSFKMRSSMNITQKALGHCQERGVGVLRVPIHSII